MEASNINNRHARQPRRRRAAAAVAARAAALLFAVALAAAAAAAPLAAAAPADADFNKVCRYSATGIPQFLFKNGLDGGLDYLFPLESGRVVDKYSKPWEACFGPKETYDIKQIKAGNKLPCKYNIKADQTVDYEEEHACDVLLKTNCYCYALRRFVGSYCEPGLGGTGKSTVKLPGE